MAPPKDKHWYSKEFNDLIKQADATQDPAKLRDALLLAEREAPWAETVGKIRLKLIRGKTPPMAITARGPIRLKRYMLNLKDFRRALEEKGWLTPEDSPE